MLRALQTGKGPLTAAETRDIREAPQVPTSSLRLPQTQPAQTIDVTLGQRADQVEETKKKFADVFKVYGACEDISVDVESFDDTVNVKGRLHLPESIKFFEKIGASEFVLKTLLNCANFFQAYV